MATSWNGAGTTAVEVSPQAGFQSRQKPPLDEFIGEAEVAKLIYRFRNGTTRQELAQHYGYSVSRVRRLLRERGVRVQGQMSQRTAAVWPSPMPLSVAYRRYDRNSRHVPVCSGTLVARGSVREPPDRLRRFSVTVRSPRRRLILAVAAISSVAVALLPSTASTADADTPTPIHIADTGEVGAVNIHAEPNADSAVLGSIPEAATPTYICFKYGPPIGGVPIWFKVTYDGVTGYYTSFYDDAHYQSNEELTQKYGIKSCEDLDSTAEPSTTTSIAADLPRGGSLYYSPYDGPNIKQVYGPFGVFERWISAPSPATLTLDQSSWHKGNDCSPSHAVPTSGSYDGKLITTLAGWSYGRNGPIAYLDSPPSWLDVDYILLLDPGNVADYTSGICDSQYPDMSVSLLNWLGADPSHKLVVLAGEVTADYDHPVDGRGHGGIQSVLFKAVKENPATNNAALRKQVIVCNYDNMNHEDIWLNFRNKMNDTPITFDSCPTTDEYPNPTAWNP